MAKKLQDEDGDSIFYAKILEEDLQAQEAIQNIKIALQDIQKTSSKGFENSEEEHDAFVDAVDGIEKSIQQGLAIDKNDNAPEFKELLWQKILDVLLDLQQALEMDLIHQEKLETMFPPMNRVKKRGILSSILAFIKSLQAQKAGGWESVINLRIEELMEKMANQQLNPDEILLLRQELELLSQLKTSLSLQGMAVMQMGLLQMIVGFAAVRSISDVCIERGYQTQLQSSGMIYETRIRNSLSDNKQFDDSRQLNIELRRLNSDQNLGRGGFVTMDSHGVMNFRNIFKSLWGSRKDQNYYLDSELPHHHHHHRGAILGDIFLVLVAGALLHSLESLTSKDAALKVEQVARSSSRMPNITAELKYVSLAGELNKGVNHNGGDKARSDEAGSSKISGVGYPEQQRTRDGLINKTSSTAVQNIIDQRAPNSEVKQTNKTGVTPNSSRGR